VLKPRRSLRTTVYEQALHRETSIVSYQRPLWDTPSTTLTHHSNCTLTQVLQDSMGGSAKMVLLLHVAPEALAQQESVSTLRFGVSAASVERAAASKTNLASADSKEVRAAHSDANNANRTVRVWHGATENGA
jgi:hypothetical protein